jgi:hypothetical protein
VYRLAQAKYEADQEAHVQKQMDKLTQDYYVKKMYADDPQEESQMRDHLRTNYGGRWHFNEIIGYIRLYFYGTQVRGEWWRISAKRVTRTRTKRFEWRHWKVVYEEEIPPDSSSAQIYALILRYLARAQQNEHLQRFHVDTSVFERIGPHVDWRAAFKALEFFRPTKLVKVEKPS